MSIEQKSAWLGAAECNVRTQHADRYMRFTVSCGSLLISATSVCCYAELSQWAPRVLFVLTGSTLAGRHASQRFQWNFSQGLCPKTELQSRPVCLLPSAAPEETQTWMVLTTFNYNIDVVMLLSLWADSKCMRTYMRSSKSNNSSRADEQLRSMDQHYHPTSESGFTVHKMFLFCYVDSERTVVIFPLSQTPFFFGKKWHLTLSRVKVRERRERVKDVRIDCWGSIPDNAERQGQVQVPHGT